MCITHRREGSTTAKAELRPAGYRRPVAQFSASTALPYRCDDRAAAGLRGQLRLAIADANGSPPDWSQLQVAGPLDVLDGLGNTWFEWQATITYPD